MRAMVRYWTDLPMQYLTFSPETVVPADFRVVCLWSAFGLALTGLFFGLGFGAEFGLALAAAG
jgi:hypothetical protein